MKTFIVSASYISYCYAEIEAENLDDAKEIARNMDGGDFEPEPCGGSDWNIDEVRELPEKSYEKET